LELAEEALEWRARLQRVQIVLTSISALSHAARARGLVYFDADRDHCGFNLGDEVGKARRGLGRLSSYGRCRSGAEMTVANRAGQKQRETETGRGRQEDCLTGRAPFGFRRIGVGRVVWYHDCSPSGSSVSAKAVRLPEEMGSRN